MSKHSTAIYVVQQQRTGPYDEIHDCLDERWHAFLHRCGLMPILLPNHLPTAQALLDSSLASGVLLTGGGQYSTSSTDTRSEIERLALNWARTHTAPVLGVCRGMQALGCMAGAELVPCEGQVTAQQSIHFNGQNKLTNSYHNYMLSDCPPNYRITGTFSQSQPTIIKAIAHHELPWHGIMWHPERITPFDQSDIALCKHIFNSQEV
jgi:putative glutamine amidotransferase